MRITLVTAHASPLSAGVWNAIADLAAEFSATGIAISVAGLVDRRSKDRAFLRGIPVVACKVLGSEAFGFAPDLGRAISDSRPDLVHAHGLWMYPSCASLSWSRRSGRPVVISPHGMLDPWALRQATWKKAIARRLFEDAHLRRAVCIQALTVAEADAIRQFGLRNAIAIVPNGVVLPVPRASSQQVPATRKMLFLGRLDRKKGIDQLLHAWAGLGQATRRDAWILRIVGWGAPAEERRLRAMTDELGLAASVEFAGPRHGYAKDACFAGADAFILPSFSEGLPMAVLEAWSHGLPVIMTPGCNLPEGFVAGAALRVEPDAASIREGLNCILNMSASERAAMGAAGRRLVEARFTWRNVARELQKVYEWVLGGGDPPACVIGGRR